MDRGTLALLIPIFALAIPIAAIVSNAFIKYAQMRAREARALQGDPGRLEELEGEVARMRRELSEVHERLDFAERALVQQRQPPRLPDSGT